MSQSPRKLTRRRFIQALAGLAVAAGTGYGYARWIEPHWVDVEEVVLPVRNLPAALEGRRLAQISDLHFGAYFTAEQLQEAIARINRLNVEWLLLSGDYASTRDRRRDSFRAAMQHVIEPLRQAAMPMYAALGNHDLWGDVHAVEQCLAAAGATVLRNDGALLAGKLWLGAVDDAWSGRPDLPAALRGAATDSVNILIAHEPDYFDVVVGRQAPVALQMSGHTHGGQVRLPTLVPGADGLFSYAPVIPDYGTRYPIGLRRVGERRVYTNRGLGCWPLPLRLNCRPEITVFELREGDPSV